MSIEKIELNKQIYEDRQAGMSWRKLSQKYNLAVTTLRTKIARIEARKLFENITQPQE